MTSIVELFIQRTIFRALSLLNLLKIDPSGNDVGTFRRLVDSEAKNRRVLTGRQAFQYRERVPSSIGRFVRDAL